MVESDNIEEIESVNTESIITELRSLRIQQAHILSRIDYLIGVLERENPPRPIAVKSESDGNDDGPDYIPRKRESKRILKKHDRIRIKNPKKDESETGTVTGFTTTGQVRIHLDSGHNTRRIRRNITFE